MRIAAQASGTRNGRTTTKERASSPPSRHTRRVRRTHTAAWKSVMEEHVGTASGAMHVASMLTATHAAAKEVLFCALHNKRGSIRSACSLHAPIFL
ncbi:hypothetical protein CNECB9_2540015 [Cupriavidus necator]|uniref:Uncharacterized protein n=1 Tax=Cupriavidus necator TaxID=106590 RepID=A0A1K0IEM1_CUPNE|nr:hypothetical protein CNECB9_2540015 [Cupriavidus necator]